jgi:hypothetical protein
MSRVGFPSSSGFPRLSDPSQPAGQSGCPESSAAARTGSPDSPVAARTGSLVNPAAARPVKTPGPSCVRGLSDRELLARVKTLVARERAVTLEILVHLIEVERRRLYLGLGYASMFDYSTRHLGYSGSAAARRIRSARCIRDYPEVYGLLETNEVTLITISLVAPILTESNVKDLIRRIRGKSQREVEAIVATYRPPVSMRDRARPVCVAVTSPSGSKLSGSRGEVTASAGSGASGFAAGPPQASTMMQALQPTGAAASDVSPPSPAITDALPAASEAKGGTISPPARMERKFLVQFLASPQFMKKFEKAKALLSNKNASLSYEAVLEAALDEFLKDHDPEKREQRREERREKTQSGTNQSNRSTAGPGRTRSRTNPPKREKFQAVRRQSVTRGGDGAPRESAEGHAATPRGRAEPSRHIPAAVRDAVFVRDKGHCTYTGPDGKRCGSTHNLQIDHVVPFARGGAATLQNLRLLCGKHNRLSAERIFGPAAVRGKLCVREPRRTT